MLDIANIKTNVDAQILNVTHRHLKKQLYRTINMAFNELNGFAFQEAIP
jgi:hypothetical protein